MAQWWQWWWWLFDYERVTWSSFSKHFSTLGEWKFPPPNYLWTLFIIIIIIIIIIIHFHIFHAIFHSLIHGDITMHARWHHNTCMVTSQCMHDDITTHAWWHHNACTMTSQHMHGDITMHDDILDASIHSFVFCICLIFWVPYSALYLNRMWRHLPYVESLPEGTPWLCRLGMLRTLHITTFAITIAWRNAAHLATCIPVHSFREAKKMCIIIIVVVCCCCCCRCYYYYYNYNYHQSKKCSCMVKASSRRKSWLQPLACYIDDWLF